MVFPTVTSPVGRTPAEAVDAPAPLANAIATATVKSRRLDLFMLCLPFDVLRDPDEGELTAPHVGADERHPRENATYAEVKRAQPSGVTALSVSVTGRNQA